MIDRRFTQQSGAMTLRFEGERAVLETVADAIGDRPWSAFSKVTPRRNDAPVDNDLTASTDAEDGEAD